MEEPDSGLDEEEGLGWGDEGGMQPPWPQQEGTEEEERELAKGVKKGGFVLGKNEWYEDMYSGVGKNSLGLTDSFHDEEEGHEENYHTQTREECKDSSNEEGYLGEADDETIGEMYEALKERYAWYERKVAIGERHPDHRLKVGDFVTLAANWRDGALGNYTSNQGREDVPELVGAEEVPFNDADQGPLYPEDVGIILQDDGDTKPYLVKAFDSVTYKAGYPYEWTDEWWYIPEALTKHTPPKPLGLAADAQVSVPGHFASVKLALKNMTEGQSLLLESGDHRFEEVIEMGDHPDGTHPAHKLLRLRTLVMEGRDGARSWGRMIFGRWARGRLTTCVLLYTTLNSYRGVVECHGGPWAFKSCEVRSAGGIAVRALTEGNVTAHECGLGGFAWPIGVNSASDGVHCEGESLVRLTQCLVDKTGRLGGCGVYGHQKARVVMQGCELTQNDHAVGYNDHSEIKMYGCRMHGNRNEAFYGGVRSLRSRMVLKGCVVDGPPWFRGRLPEYLGLTSEYPGDNVLGPIPDPFRWPVRALNITLPVLDDRIQARARVTVPVHWDGEHSMG